MKLPRVVGSNTQRLKPARYAELGNIQAHPTLYETHFGILKLFRSAVNTLRLKPASYAELGNKKKKVYSKNTAKRNMSNAVCKIRRRNFL